VLRSHQADPSEVLQVFCAKFAEFMACLVHPPQPLAGRVTSMIQWGLRNGVEDWMKVFQSSRVLGAKILLPIGQLFFCVVL
jgi:hypothetical protein